MMQTACERYPAYPRAFCGKVQRRHTREGVWRGRRQIRLDGAKTAAGKERRRTRINRDYVLDEMMVELPEATDILCSGAFLALRERLPFITKPATGLYYTGVTHPPPLTKPHVSQQSPGRTYFLLVEITVESLSSWHSLRRYFVQLLGVENSLSAWFWFLFWDPAGRWDVIGRGMCHSTAHGAWLPLRLPFSVTLVCNLL